MDNTLCEGAPFMLNDIDESVENSGYSPDPWYIPPTETETEYEYEIYYSG